MLATAPKSARMTIGDFTAGAMYAVAEVASLFGYEQETVRGWIRDEQAEPGTGLPAVRMPFSGVRVRRPKQPQGRPNYRIDGADVLRLWGRMDLEAAAEVDATPIRSASPKDRVHDAFDRLKKLKTKH